MSTPRDLAVDRMTCARIVAGSPVLRASRLVQILTDLATAHNLPSVAVALQVPADPARALRDVRLYLDHVHDLLGTGATHPYTGVWSAADDELDRLAAEVAKRSTPLHAPSMAPAPGAGK